MKTVKFQIGELLGIGMTLVVLGIGLAYGLQVMGDVRGDICEGDGYQYVNSTCYTDTNYNVTTGGVAYNATEDAMTGVAKIPEKLPTIVTVIIASIIIGILVTYLWARFK